MSFKKGNETVFTQIKQSNLFHDKNFSPKSFAQNSILQSLLRVSIGQKQQYSVEFKLEFSAFARRSTKNRSYFSRPFVNQQALVLFDQQ